MPLPRLLMLGALLWCMAAFILTIGTGVPIQPTTLSYTPGARALIFMLAFGAFALYPLARIATARGWWSPARVSLDALTLSVLFTILFWPMQLVTAWPRSLGIAIWLLVLGWIWVASAVCAYALTLTNGWARAACALACPAALAAGAMFDAAGIPAPWPWLLGPAVAVLDAAPAAPWIRADNALALALYPWCIALVAWPIAMRRARREFAALAQVG